MLGSTDDVFGTHRPGSAAFIRRVRAWVAECRPSCSTPRPATIADAPTEVVDFCQQHAPARYANLPLYAYVGYHQAWRLASSRPITYTDDVGCRWAATLTSEPSAALTLLVPSAGPDPQRFVCGPHLFAGCVAVPNGHEYERPLAAVPAYGSYNDTLVYGQWFVGTPDLLVLLSIAAKIHASPSATALTRASMTGLLASIGLPVPRR